MARRYYRSRRTVVVRPKKKWASNISQLSFQISENSSTTTLPGRVIVENSAQSSVPTPTILKVGNFKVGADISFSYSSAPNVLPNVTIYIIYVPEGFVLQTNANLATLISNHPEYVMAWKKLNFDFVNGAGTYNAQSVTVSSRLKRNLNSGDKVFFGVYTTNSQSTSVLTVQGTIQFWTCAN